MAAGAGMLGDIGAGNRRTGILRGKDMVIAVACDAGGRIGTSTRDRSSVRAVVKSGGCVRMALSAGVGQIPPAYRRR